MQSLLTASVAALVITTASAINPARYVRIYDSQNDPSDYINLQLVTVFGTPPSSLFILLQTRPFFC